MPMTLHSVGTTQEEVEAIRTFRPWVREVTREMMGADRNYGDYAFAVAVEREVNGIRHAAIANAMQESDCALCRNYAGATFFPAHDAPLAGHPNHCTCGGCW